MIISGKSIIKQTGEKVSAKEFWNNFQITGENLGLTIIGFGTPEINIYLQQNLLSYFISLKTEIGNIEIEYEDLKNEYVVLDQYWVPLDATVSKYLYEIIQSSQATPRSIMPLGRFYKFISEVRESGYTISDFQDWENFRLEELTKTIDMALPLYEYQKSGVSWLISLFDQEIGALLCDEMGLGKTAQAFGLIKHAREKGNSKILVITPASLTMNWSREIRKFVPDILYYLHKGPNRKFNPADFDQNEITIVSYDLFVRDFSLFSKFNWDLVVCDEAQALKNSDSKRHECVSNLNSLRKVLITGTPVENSLKDLWSLINLVRPGLLGTKRSFAALIDDHPFDAQRLSQFAYPLMLRRLVSDVAKDLPELVSIDEALVPNDLFSVTYENYRKEGLKLHGNLLPLLTKLIQICCYPKLVIPDYADPHDVKLVRTLEILGTIKAYKSQKAIIFSTFTESIDLLKNVITRQLQPNFIAIIDGRISPEKRMAIVDTFEAVEGFSVLIIQPNAGGVGLNITAANHVIHFNRQWNPAVEKQATARAYRRGQLQTVFEYRMFYLGTIEEFINDRLISKTELAATATEDAVAEGSEKDIQKALAISPMFL